MESGASLATRNPRTLASPRVKVGPGTVRFPGFQRRMRGARLVATGAFGRWSVPVESKLSCELGEAGVGAIACGDHRRRNALERIHGFGDFGVTTVAIRAIFKKKFSGIEGLIRKDREDGDDEEEEDGYRGGKSSDDDDTEDTTDLIRKDHEDGDDEEEEGGYRGGKNSDDDDTEDTTDDEEDTSSTDEEDTSSDEEDTSEDEDDDERECDD